MVISGATLAMYSCCFTPKGERLLIMGDGTNAVAGRGEKKAFVVKMATDTALRVINIMSMREMVGRCSSVKPSATIC